MKQLHAILMSVAALAVLSPCLEAGRELVEKKRATPPLFSGNDLQNNSRNGAAKVWVPLETRYQQFRRLMKERNSKFFPDGATGLEDVKLAAGGYHSLEVKFDGTVWVTGWNSNGQMGNGTTNNLSLPQQVLANNYNSMALQNVKSVAGGYQHSAVLMNDGTVWTWGADGSGQLGNGSPNTDSTLPVQVPGLTDVSRISAGSNHCVIVKGNRTVWTWGLGASGQLGNGGNVSTNQPIQVAGLTNAVVVAAGGSHTLALTVSGVWAWGNNLNGQLGIGNNISTNRPVLVTSIGAAEAVAAGGSHSLALMANGTVLVLGHS